ncbi:MAG: 3-dehydroquinate synthase [Bacteroidetes bacterium]|nr:3-dehydroquinate synthase [Bacteroidota bacterium]MCL5025889.1 3-dehydroquinate synthase [Chloroflexota bacterium]
MPDCTYNIWLGEGILSLAGDLLLKAGLGRTLALVTNPAVAALYAAPLEASLQAAGFAVRRVTIADGEQYKTLATVDDLYSRFLAAGLERGSAVVALGGGVVGDTAGFAAATYMRGIPFVQVPTTLLAQVDSSVGGKVAVDHARAKNLVGAFHQPRAVIIDTAVLRTLLPQHLRCGLAEIVKHGVLGSPALFEHLERHGAEPMDRVVREALAVKIRVVQQDPEERGVRAILNLGHTTGHAVEAVTSYRVPHGDGVAIGMVAATHMALALGLCAPDVLPRLLALLGRFGLPTSVEADPNAIYEAMFADKKKKEGRLRFILPQAIGSVIISDQVPEEVVRLALARITTQDISKEVPI